MPEEDEDQVRVTFFFDRSIGKAVPVALDVAGVSTVRHDDYYPPQQPVPDEQWIGEQTALDRVLVTKDKGIRHRHSEVSAIQSARARLLVLTDGRATRLRMLRALLIAWPEVQEVILTKTVGPWILSISGGGTVTKLG